MYLTYGSILYMLYRFFSTCFLFKFIFMVHPGGNMDFSFPSRAWWNLSTKWYHSSFIHSPVCGCCFQLMINTLLLYTVLHQFSPANTWVMCKHLSPPRKGKLSHRVWALHSNTRKRSPKWLGHAPFPSSKGALHFHSPYCDCFARILNILMII